jgi:hypothetical protein
MTVAVLALGLGACRSARPQPVPPTPADAATAAQAKVKEAAMQDWQGQFSGALQGAQRVIESPAQWQALWSEIGQGAPDAPDFKSSFAVAVFLGQRNTGGCGVAWLKPDSSGPATVVRYKETKPQGITMQVLTQPYAVKVFPRGKFQILVEAAPN